MAAVGEHRELNPCGPPVFEERVDRSADRAARVEDVVDEDHRAALDVEVELRVAHDRLRAARRLASAHVHVVAVEGDVELAELELDPGALLDQSPEAVCERDPARVDADERDRVEILVALDDLVCDPRECAADGFTVEQNPPAGCLSAQTGMLMHRSPFRPHWVELKECVSKAMRVRAD